MRLLGVGIATVDLVSTVPDYPLENSEVRAEERWVSRGGNVTNSLAVLGQLGHQCSWIGTLADDAWSAVIREDLQRNRVDHRRAVTVTGGASPLSCVVLAKRSGSRTIVHHRRLPELTAKQFAQVDLTHFDWVHFEGRNVEQLEEMLERVRALPQLVCSLEIEKPRGGLERLLPLADLLMFSSDYTRSAGLEPGEPFLDSLRARVATGAQATVTAGRGGAWGLDRDGAISHAPANPPAQVIDTLAAGDVFNAGLIDALSRGRSLAGALTDGCRLAGRKCGRQGIQDLIDG